MAARKGSPQARAELAERAFEEAVLSPEAKAKRQAEEAQAKAEEVKAAVEATPTDDDGLFYFDHDTPTLVPVRCTLPGFAHITAYFNTTLTWRVWGNMDRSDGRWMFRQVAMLVRRYTYENPKTKKQEDGWGLRDEMGAIPTPDSGDDYVKLYRSPKMRAFIDWLLLDGFQEAVLGPGFRGRVVEGADNATGAAEAGE